MQAEQLVSVQAELGEGPLWSERDQALWFVDIKAPCIYRYDPATAELQRFAAPAHVGWVLPGSDGGWIAGLKSGPHRFDPADGSFTAVAEVDAEHPHNRLNDAATDPSGRIWFGTMDNLEQTETGSVYCLDGDTVAHSGVPPIVITNGPAVSPDGGTLYLVDTLGLKIDAHPINPDGSVGAGRRFATFDGSGGHPDGATCDAEGNVWVGFYGGWAARRFSPAGELTAEVRFPVSNVTKLAIGGPDGRTAFATTARQGLSPEQLAQQPLAGDIFTFRVDVPGQPVTPARSPR